MAILTIFKTKNGYFFKISSGHPDWDGKTKLGLGVPAHCSYTVQKSKMFEEG
jgi:hypothetical protein